jgi:aspartyl aminopeptidase
MAKVMSKAIEGEDLNIIIGSTPFSKENSSGSDLVKLNILDLLNKKYGIIEEDFNFSELSFVPALKSRDIGIDSSLIGAYGHDDRCCAYASLRAILELAENKKIPDNTGIVFFVDKEEIGSDGTSGMKSSFLQDFLEYLAEISGSSNRESFPKSKCMSADVDAAYDPSFSEQYDALNSSYINKGVVINKYTGSAGKSGSSDASAELMGYIRKLFQDNKIIFQCGGGLGRVDAGGGGTVAKYLANLNIDTVDIGIPVLSMHSPFEIVSKFDLFVAKKAFLCHLS